MQKKKKKQLLSEVVKAEKHVEIASGRVNKQFLKGVAKIPQKSVYKGPNTHPKAPLRAKIQKQTVSAAEFRLQHILGKKVSDKLKTLLGTNGELKLYGEGLSLTIPWSGEGFALLAPETPHDQRQAIQIQAYRQSIQKEAGIPDSVKTVLCCIPDLAPELVKGFADHNSLSIARFVENGYELTIKTPHKTIHFQARASQDQKFVNLAIVTEKPQK